MLRVWCAGEEGECREFTHGHGTDEGCIRGRESTKEMQGIYEWKSGRHEAFHAGSMECGRHEAKTLHNSGGDALRGDTRSHPEHDG